MKNKLTDLNNYLFEQIERINEDGLDEKQLQAAITKAEAITNVAQTIIQNGALQLKTADLLIENGLVPRESLTLLLGTSDNSGKNTNQIGVNNEKV